MTSVILSLLYVLSFTVSGFVGKGLRPRCSSEISLMRNFASATPAGAGEVDFQPSSISSVTKRDCSLAVTMAAAVLMLPKITAATTAASLGVDKDGYFEFSNNLRTNVSTVCPGESPLSGCVSSQDDRPACFLAPWEYDGNYLNAKKKVLQYLSTISGLTVISGGTAPAVGGTLDFQAPEENTSRYIRAEIVDKKKFYEDDLEFYFTPNDNTVQYRALRRVGVDLLALENKNRIEKMRLALRFSNIPILRNRRRVLFFVESPLDTFGPPTIMFDKLLDNISGEMEFKNGVVGDLDPLSPIWETPSTAAIKMKKEKDKKKAI